MKNLLLSIALLHAQFGANAAEIDRIWLTHQTNDPSKLVVNWETAAPGDSVVEFGTAPSLGERVATAESVTLHHVEIPLAKKDVTYHYRVRSGMEASAVHQFNGYPSDELRVAVVADTGYAKQSWAAAVLRENPHLLLSAGDHVPALHSGQPVARENTGAFSRFVTGGAVLFQSTPWMPALGNHDREIRPRGPKPPPEPAYDIEATAFRDFFALPGDEWRWHFDVPDFGVRFVALDFSHLSDQGTTWQTCHPFARDGVQFGWYRDLMAGSREPFVITLYNERNSTVRGLEGGEWGRMIAQGTLAITGFGYFGERAELSGIPFYNTSVSGTGTPYADPKSVVLKSEDNFMLLTFHRAPARLRVELKNLSGEVLDRKEFRPRGPAQETKPQ
ncbi:MAG: metallophosphoesterase [Chthoniobacteraceae bacterium]